MIDVPETLIDYLNKRLGSVLSNSFRLEPSKLYSYNIKLFKSVGNRKAINRYDDNMTEVNVYNWFKDYYLYIEIKFMYEHYMSKKKKSNSPSAMLISVSVFKYLLDNIVQLFRAEWDEYKPLTEGIHPQPHWHIISDISTAHTFQEYARDFGEDGFLGLFDNERKYISNLYQVHFAMGARWENNISEASTLDSNEQIGNWLCGLFSSLKIELESL